MLLSVALSKVAPVLFPSPPGQTIEVQSLINDLARINAVAAAADQEGAYIHQL